MAEITEVDACLTGDGSSLKDHESDERIGQPGLVDEPWKDEDGVVCDPEHMKKWSFARKDTQRMGPITKGKMCFGAKGVKKMERIGTNALSLHLPCDSAWKIIIDGDEFRILGHLNDKVNVEPGSEYAIKNPRDETQIIDFIHYSGPFNNDKAEESSDDESFTESPTEFLPDETGEESDASETTVS